MSKIKVIDLLNKIEKGELNPKTEIKYNGKTYVYDFPNLCGIYEKNKPTNIDYNLLGILTDVNHLQNEVEVIEIQSKADKMFTGVYYDKIYDRENSVVYHEKYEDIEIEFDKESKTVDISRESGEEVFGNKLYLPVELTYETIKAINEKCKELGWNV